ncbi:hypothetical protein ElyMa_003261000 [Elysia marginata]|uniref:Uncharacterized protein n=1 Tax=Elysia marginata TaxID=1093978 RepID=A0AAV4J682_9GAST|nr:hypothetical protein ElyMa_003261000 [Elysia marginata]
MRCNHFLRRYTASEDGTSGNEHVHFRNYRKPVLIVQQWIPLCYCGGGEGGNEGEDEKEVHRKTSEEKRDDMYGGIDQEYALTDGKFGTYGLIVTLALENDKVK